MATQYTSILKLALPVQGELSGTWGDAVNDQVTSMVEEAIAGLKTINTWVGNSATLSTADGATSESRAAILNLTDTTSDLSGAATLICPAASKVYIVKNATGQAVTVKTASGTGIAIPNGTTGFVFCDGTNVVEAINNVTGNLTVGGNASIGGNLTVTGTTTFNGGTLTLGDANTDNIVFGGEIDSSIIPDDDDTYDLGSSTQQWRNIFIDGTAEIDTLALDGTTVTSTAAELNILDGVTSTTAELNILDGVTSTTAELNILDGVTSTTAELNIMDGDTSATSTTVADADRVVFNDAGTMKQVAVTDLAAYFDDEITAMPNLVTVSTLDSGAISSGFGNIDIGSSNLTATGTISLGATSFNDNNITNVGSIQLDSIAGDADTNTSITFSGSDVITMTTGGTTALTIDASQNVTVAGDLTISGDDLTMGTNTADMLLIADGTNFNPTAIGDLSSISTVANDDVFLAIDTSGGGLKKITRSTIVSGLAVGGVALSNVVEDTTPQLGGDLDVNGNGLVSTSNGNIAITPNGSGVVRLDGNVDIQSGTIDLKNSGSRSKINFYCESGNAHAQALQAAPHSESASNTLTLPSTGGDVDLVSTASTATLTNKTFGDDVSFGDNNITNVGDIALDSVSADGNDINIAVTDNRTTAFTIKQGSDNYFVVDTGNSSESIAIGTGVSGTAITLGHSTSEVTVADNLTVTGDLTVSGTTTTVNSTTVNLNDHNIVLDSGNSTSAVINGAGITIEGGSGDDATFTYNTTGPQFELKLGSSFEDLQTAKLTATELDISGDVDVDGTLETDALSINGTTVTATAAELNILDGVTASATDINLIDGITNGTVIASKAIITDSNKDITGGRNITISGELDAATLDISGDADIDGTLEADAITVGGTALNTVIAGVTVTNATTAAVATTVTISDNESTNEDNAIIFTSGGDIDGGNIGLESDGTLTYNPSTGTVTATIFKGNIDAVDGDFDGTLETDALSIAGTTVTATAAELNHVDGVTSAIQTQLDAKASKGFATAMAIAL